MYLRTKRRKRQPAERKCHAGSENEKKHLLSSSNGCLCARLCFNLRAQPEGAGEFRLVQALLLCGQCTWSVGIVSYSWALNEIDPRIGSTSNLNQVASAGTWSASESPASQPASQPAASYLVNDNHDDDQGEAKLRGSCIVWWFLFSKVVLCSTLNGYMKQEREEEGKTWTKVCITHSKLYKLKLP